MKKAFSLAIFSFVFSFSLIVVKPAQAQSFGQAVPNFFTNFKNSIKRLYLKAIPGSKSGEAVLEQSFYRLETIETLSYKNHFNVDFESAEQNLGHLDLSISGPIQMKNLYQPQQNRQALTIAGRYDTQGQSFNFKTNLVTDQETLYLKIDEIPSFLDLGLDEFTQQWLSMPLPSQTEEENDELNQEQKAKLKEVTENLIQKAELSQAKKEKLEGTPVFVIEATLETEAISEYLQKIGEITQPEELNNGENAIVTQETAEVEEATDKFEKMDPIKLTFWIGRDNFYPRKIETSLQLAELNNEEATSKLNLNSEEIDEALEAEKIELKISLILDRFNQPIEIETPESARPISELFAEMFGFGFEMQQFPDQTPDQIMPGMAPTNEENVLPQNYNTDAPEMPEIPGMSQEEQQKILEQYGL